MEQRMKDEKKDKKVVQLKEEQQKQNRKIDVAPSKRVEKTTISFDTYFQILMKLKPGILAHHKAPMRNYAESKGLKRATREEFDQIFRLY